MFAVDVGALDGASVILSALAAGADEGVPEVVKQGVLDLRDKIKAGFGHDEAAAADLSVYTQRPAPQDAEPLSGHLRAHGLDQDREVIAVARTVLDAAGPTAVDAGSVAAAVINIRDHGQGFIGGTHHHYGSAGEYADLLGPPDSQPELWVCPRDLDDPDCARVHRVPGQDMGFCPTHRVRLIPAAGS